MYEYIPQALASLQPALVLGKSLIGINDSVKAQDILIKFNGAIIDAQSKIITSQQDLTTMGSKIDELKNEIEVLQGWENERKKYSRREISTGVFVYIEKNYTEAIASAHKYCCNCFDNKKNRHFNSLIYVKVGK